MKQTILAMLVVLFLVPAKAQNYYTFSESTAPYQSINGTKVSPEGFLVWQNGFSMQLPFNFTMIDRTMNIASVSNYGDVFFTLQNENRAISLLPVGAPLADYFDAAAVYAGVLGTNPGTRIAVIEFSNMNFEVADKPEAYINYQIWLYEKDNAIEFRYGPSADITANSYLKNGGPATGIFDIDRTDFSLERSFFLTGDSNAPVFNDADTDRLTDSLPSIKGNIAEGTVYRFEYVYQPTGIKNTNGVAPCKIYPNPSTGNFFISFSEQPLAPVQVTVTDMLGKTVHTQTITENNTAIAAGHLSPGMYMVAVVCNGITSWQKIQVN